MNVSITKAKFDEKNTWLALSDDRILGVPLALLPLLLNFHVFFLHSHQVIIILNILSNYKHPLTCSPYSYQL